MTSTALWKSRRKLFAHEIAQNSISSYVPLIVRSVQQWTTTWAKKEPHTAKVDFLHETNLLTFDIIMGILFGDDCR